MIKGRYIGGLEEDIDFEITLEGDNKKITTDSEGVKRYIQNIDTTLDFTPVAGNIDVEFETASERELVMALQSATGYKVDEYPDDITLIEEPDREEGIIY